MGVFMWTLASATKTSLGSVQHPEGKGGLAPLREGARIRIMQPAEHPQGGNKSNS